jgi:hypothetical protein
VAVLAEGLSKYIGRQAPPRRPIIYRTTTQKTSTTTSTTNSTTTTTTNPPISICNSNLISNGDLTIRCKQIKNGRLCHLICPTGSAFENGHSRKIYFCSEKRQQWQPEKVLENCPIRVQNFRKPGKNSKQCSKGHEMFHDTCRPCEPGNA